jgi:hypothetical protein
MAALRLHFGSGPVYGRAKSDMAWWVRSRNVPLTNVAQSCSCVARLGQAVGKQNGPPGSARIILGGPACDCRASGCTETEHGPLCWRQQGNAIGRMC